VNSGRIEEWNRAVLVFDQQADFRAPQDDALRAGFNQLLDDPDIFVLGFLLDQAEAEFLINVRGYPAGWTGIKKLRLKILCLTEFFQGLGWIERIPAFLADLYLESRIGNGFYSIYD